MSVSGSKLAAARNGRVSLTLGRDNSGSFARNRAASAWYRTTVLRSRDQANYSAAGSVLNMLVRTHVDDTIICLDAREMYVYIVISVPKFVRTLNH